MLTEAERETIDLVFRAKRKLGLTPRETELLFALVREGKFEGFHWLVMAFRRSD